MVERDGLDGPRFVIDRDSAEYPELLKQIHRPPKQLFCIGDREALKPGVGIIGARKATPYGLSCAEYFAAHAAMRGIDIISGGARGCDQAAHRAAVEAGTPTVVVFGCGADVAYPKSGRPLFEKVIAQGGLIVSEMPWGTQPRPAMFPQRNRLIAGLSVLLLIVEAGLPSGTLTTADEALAQGKEVAVVPGAITSPYAKGVNRLFSQGATPVVDCETFDDALEAAFASMPIPMLQREGAPASLDPKILDADPVLRALCAEPLSAAELAAYYDFSVAELSRRLSEYEVQGLVQRGRDGRYQVCLARR